MYKAHIIGYISHVCGFKICWKWLLHSCVSHHSAYEHNTHQLLIYYKWEMYVFSTFHPFELFVLIGRGLYRIGIEWWPMLIFPNGTSVEREKKKTVHSCLFVAILTQRDIFYYCDNKRLITALSPSGRSGAEKKSPPININISISMQWNVRYKFRHCISVCLQFCDRQYNGE